MKSVEYFSSGRAGYAGTGKTIFTNSPLNEHAQYKRGLGSPENGRKYYKKWWKRTNTRASIYSTCGS